ncbi:MAG: DUF84 family protein [Calditrichae bacterium]|nr:DUF84 family protein [Calditrichia bacterium]
MHIAIATTNKAKVKACESAFDKLKNVFKNQFPSEIHFSSYKANSDVSDMPLSLNEIMQGARNRALFIYKKLTAESLKFDYIIGMEGGVFKTKPFSAETDQAILQNWVFVYNGQQGYYGSSAGLVLPQKISEALYQKKLELADVIDHYSGKEDVRSNEGAFGLLTENLYDRRAAFESAVINATVPFLNKNFYK